MNRNTFIINAKGDLLLQDLLFLRMSAAHSIEPVDPLQVPDELKKSFETLVKCLKADGFGVKIDDVSISALIMVSGRVTQRILFATIALGAYNPAHMEYVIEEEIVVGKRMYFLGNYKFLSIAVEGKNNIFIVGNIPILGNWNPDNALPLIFIPSRIAAFYIDIPIISGQIIEFKFLRKENGYITWETGPNREIIAGEQDISMRYHFNE